ncbi:MAG TPA: helical backbone metal receptor [Chryseosolibacter sp.]|nr:helical backbone metal receptor [Chryseosolibacter sp.]
MPLESFIDQTGSEIRLSGSPTRIVSLVPSQTELLYHLGLEPFVVGITKYCVHPTQWRESKTVVGGTKTPDLEVISRLQPQLIIGNKEENRKADIQALRSNFPVWISDVGNLDDALGMIRSVAAMTDTYTIASGIIGQIEEGFARIKKGPPKSALYLMWRKPWMAAGAGTFIDAMLGKIGLRNCIGDRRRYPELTPDLIAAITPEIVFLSSEPFPFREKHVKEVRALWPQSRILLVDGEMFSWYGSRLIQAADYFSALALD